MIKLNNVSFSRCNKKILDQASLMIHENQKVGLIGKNGSGKTSLMKLLMGELSTDAGNCSITKNRLIRYLKQEIPQTAMSARQYVLQGDQPYSSLLQALATAEKNNQGMKIAELHMQLSEIDGYAVPAKASKILHGLGFKQNELDNTITSFSGGWQMRLNLAQLLMSRADILLLDEPTNHLDLEAIVWLENWLKTCTQTILLVSHDRHFIDNVVTHIAHLENLQLKLYTGNYASFEKQLAEQLAVQQATYEKQQAARAHMQHYVDRFRYKASKARQAQSRLKMLERMVLVSPTQIQNAFRFHFKACSQAGDPMLNLENVSLGYEDRIILSKINCSIRDGDRIGLIGPNGAGKSTLIKLIANALPVKAGACHGSNKIKVGYFAQHQLELLDPADSPIAHLIRTDHTITEAKARQYLGGFAFANDDVFRPVNSFSGGEKARLVLALIIWQAPNLLLLDEPTNHLDLEMREALNLALQEYSGALILVSHDRHLLNCVTSELWLVANGRVAAFDGDLDDYQRWVLEQATTDKATIAKKEKNIPKQPIKNPLELEKLEKQLAQYEKERTEIEESLCDSSLYQKENQQQIDKLNHRLSDVKKAIDRLEEQLLDWYS